MSIFINNEEITEEQILHVMKMLKEEHHHCDCGCEEDHQEHHHCDCGCEEDHHGERRCNSEHDILEPSEKEIRDQAEAFLIQNLILKQHVMEKIPESTDSEIQAFISLHGDRYKEIADISIRMDKFSIELDSIIEKPSHEEVLNYYNNNKEDMIDEENILIPFEDLEDELTDELYDEMKNANFECKIQQLLDKAKIEYK